MAYSVYTEFFAEFYKDHINEHIAQAIESGAIRPLAEGERYMCWVSAQKGDGHNPNRKLNVWLIIVTNSSLPKSYAYNPTTHLEERCHEESGIRFYYTRVAEQGYAHMAEHFANRIDNKLLASEIMFHMSKRNQLERICTRLSAWLDVTSITKVTEILRPNPLLCAKEDAVGV